MVKITTVDSFPGINQVIMINITGITINPGEHIVILIKTEFAGEDQPCNPGYFDSGTGPPRKLQYLQIQREQSEIATLLL